MEQIKVYLLSLGCAKNLVDSEVISGALRRDNFTLTDEAAQADVIIINTCGFIEAAKKESIAAILELAAYKEQGRCRLLVAVGCMAEKYAAEMREALPELDLLSGSRDYAGVSRLVAERLGLDYAHPAAPPADDYLLRELTPGAASAYLKIAEGCDNRCSYCLIPQLRGPYISRPREDILREAERLLDLGVKEIVLIAQDTTRYGRDLYGSYCLPELLDSLARLPFAMIRLLYAYPDLIDDALLGVMAGHDNICPYLDLPIQHASDRVLSAMRRSGCREELLDALARIRRHLPDAALRTTVMVGFPGETEEEFQELLDFLAAAEFDWLGAFAYCQEEDTPAAGFAGQVDEDIKQQRLDTVMRQAALITERRQRRMVGRTLTVLIEEPAPDKGEGWYCGRSAYQAPEVDGAVFFRPRGQAVVGQLARVRITGQDIYDLIGEVQP